MRLSNLRELENYFRKKIDFGGKLLLKETTILQVLTHGLNTDFQIILIVYPPANTTELYRLVELLVVVPTPNTTTITVNSEPLIPYQQHNNVSRPFQHPNNAPRR